MAASNLISRIGILFRQPPLLILQNMLSIIPSQPLQVARFFLLSLSETPGNYMRGFGEVREGTTADVEAMRLLEDKKNLFIRRFEEGEFCVVAVHEGQLVGYEWFSDKEFHYEDRFKYRLEIPADTLYAYDGFIKREYRLRGIWVLFQSYILERLKLVGRKKIITMVDYGNDASLKAHLRFGFIINKDVCFVRLFSRRIFNEKTIAPECFNVRKVIAQ
jgi:GNAT superfamily N-acetyltransferase